MTEEFDAGLFPSVEEAKGAEDVWQQGVEQTSKQNPVGTFTVSFDEITLGRSTSSGRLQITYKMTILAGESKDSEIRKYDGLETSQQASITQQQLERLGIDAKTLSLQQLPAALLTLRDKRAVVMCKQNGQYYNVYFQRLVQEGAGEFDAGANRF